MTSTGSVDHPDARSAAPDPLPPVSGVLEERVAPPARRLVRLTETKPDGRRLTRYVLAEDHDPDTTSER
jgi:hypothetical protein